MTHYRRHSISSDIGQQGANELSLVAREVRVKNIHDQHQARRSSNIHGVLEAVVEHYALPCAPMTRFTVHCDLCPAVQ
jgi:hypothetical protein